MRLEVTASGLVQLSPEALSAARDEEQRLAHEEKLLRERDEKRNELETAIYAYRDRVIDEAFTVFANQGTLDSISALLDECV